MLPPKMRLSLVKRSCGGAALLVIVTVAITLAAVSAARGSGSDPEVPAAIASGSQPSYGFKYAEAVTQTLPAGEYARGLKATLIVEHPRLPARRTFEHSLAEIALSDPDMPGTWLEAGWVSEADPFSTAPVLFVNYWRRGKSLGCRGVESCGNVTTGWVQTRSSGILPEGVGLRPGSRLTLEWRQAHRRWTLLVNGKPIGYYPDSLWHGLFTRTNFAELYGEVWDYSGECIPMGNGKWPTQPGAARIFNAAFIAGPAVSLQPYDVSPGYGLQLTGPNSFRYGGRGC